MSTSEAHPVTIITTGGTIAMQRGTDPTLGARELLGDLLGTAGDLTLVDLYAIASEHVTLAHAHRLATCIEQAVAAGRRVVVTHGTDTLEEIAFLMAEVTGNVDCTFTAAMRPSDAVSADGPRNLRDAVTAARDRAGRGVVVCMNQELIPAYAVTKRHSVSADSFEARSGGPIGRVGSGSVQVLARPAAANWLATGTALLADRQHVGVPIIDLGCAPDPELVTGMLALVEHGCVIKGLGAGQLPRSVRPAVLELARRMPVVLTSRCYAGPVTDEESYPGAWDELIAAGVHLEQQLDAYKARIRLMLALAADRPYEPFVLRA